jgi:hypothetical protein
MLLHGYLDRVGAAAVFATVAGATKKPQVTADSSTYFRRSEPHS